MNNKNNNNGETPNWDEYPIEVSSDETVKKESTGQIDEDLHTPAHLKPIDAPSELTTKPPDKPSMLEILANWKKRKIIKTEYMDQFKLYTEAQTTMYADQVEKTLEGHKTLTQAALKALQEKVKVWGKEIMLVTDMSIQDAVNRAILLCQDNANKALIQLAKSNAHPVLVKKSMKSVTDYMMKTMNQIMNRSVSFDENGKVDWE
jgi:hypothetical protein